MDNYFNLHRFFLVIKRDLIENGRSALFGILTILSVFSFILIMTAFDTEQIILNELGHRLYILEFWLIGIFLSGMAFKDFRNKERTMTYLTLPASTFEKFLSMLLLSTVGFFISFTVLFGLFNLLNAALIHSFSEHLTLDIYNPFNEDVGATILVFLPIQSIFLAGAATFKKVPIFYTALSVFLFFLIYGFIASLVVKNFAGSISWEQFNKNGSLNLYINHNINENSSIQDFISINASFFFFTYLLAPIFWLVSWFKIKEKEV